MRVRMSARACVVGTVDTAALVIAIILFATVVVSFLVVQGYKNCSCCKTACARTSRASAARSTSASIGRLRKSRKAHTDKNPAYGLSERESVSLSTERMRSVDLGEHTFESVSFDKEDESVSVEVENNPAFLVDALASP